MFDWFFEFLYGIIKTMLFCIDFIMDMAGMLCGISPVTVDGQESDITQVFLTDERVLDAFRYTLVIGFILLFVFTIYAVIRSILKQGEGKTPIQIFLEAAKAMGWFLLVPAFMLIGSIFVSTVMTSVYNATSAGSAGIGSAIFTVIAEEAYDGAAAQDQIMDQFFTGKLDYYDTDVVDRYFDLKDLNYFIGFMAPLVVLVLIALALLAFVERLINIVLLFIISPIAVSSSVLDEGARFKLWRDQVINQFLMAYGSLIAINVFMLMVGVVNTISFFDSSLLNGLARLVFILGGAIACYKAKAIVGNVINQGAGTQASVDSSAANGIMGGILGATVGRAAGVAASVLGLPAQFLGNKAATSLKDRLAKGHNARNAVRTEAAKNKYSEKVLNSNSSLHKSTRAGLMTQADIKKTLYGEKKPGQTMQDAVGSRGSRDAGRSGTSTPAKSSAHEDRSRNEKAADRVKDALHSSAGKSSSASGGGTKKE